MILALPGWFVVHAFWSGVLLAGLAALLLALLERRSARLRHAVACAALAAMVVLPLAATLATIDFLPREARIRATETVEATVGLEGFVTWRGRIVRGAAIVWATGLTVAAIGIVRAARRVRRLRRAGNLDPGDLPRQLVDRLRRELGIPARIEVVASPAVDTPMLLGWRRPTILLPLSTPRELTSDQLRAVLAHELAHVRRRDYAGNLLQLAADAILWFHPAARWLSGRARLEREYCCDDVAVSVTAAPSDYARALATLEDMRHDCPVVIAAASGTLFDRISRVVGRPRQTITPARAAGLLVLAAAAASLVIAIAQLVPPAVPLDARLRSRSPVPRGAQQPPASPATPRLPGGSSLRQ